MNSFWQLFKFSGQSFLRNFWLSMVTLTIVLVAVFAGNIVWMINILAEEAVHQVKERIDMNISFKRSVSAEEVKAVQFQLEELLPVSDVSYLSRSEALESFQLKHQGNSYIKDSLDKVEVNPFGDSLVVKATTLEGYQEILSFLEDSKFFSLIDNQEQLVDYGSNQDLFVSRVSSWSNKLREIGVYVIGLFAFISVLVIINTIRVNIYTHSEEIAIMKLVGASNWFVRLPFMIESLFTTLLGLMITFCLLYPLLVLTEPWVKVFFGNSFSLLVYYGQHGWYLFFIELFAISVLNILVSFFAVSRYLKV